MVLPLAAAGAAAGRAVFAGAKGVGKTAATAGKVGTRAVKTGVQAGAKTGKFGVREIKRSAHQRIRDRLSKELAREDDGEKEDLEPRGEGEETQQEQEPPTPEELYERRKAQLEHLRNYLSAPRPPLRPIAHTPLQGTRVYRAKEIPGVEPDTFLPALRRAQLSAARAGGRMGRPSGMGGKGGIIKGAGKAGVAGAAATAAMKGAKAVKRFFPPLKRSQKARAPQDNAPALLSPEGVAMLATAVFWDFAPLLITIPLDFLFDVGEIIDWIPDILATLTLGVWIYIRSGQMTLGGKLTQFLKRRGILIAAEFIPHVGWVPWWTINVFFFLKK